MNEQQPINNIDETSEITTQIHEEQEAATDLAHAERTLLERVKALMNRTEEENQEVK